MDLEEQTLDQVGDRCEECGAKLTPQEQKAALEPGGRALCTVHAAETEPGLAVEDDPHFQA
jgi:methionyl-tRNA synthetase